MEYYHARPQSIESVVAKLILRINGRKKLLERQSTKGDYTDFDIPLPPDFITRDLQVETTRIGEKNVFIISPVDSKSEKNVLFLHGGAYVQNMSSHHWQLVGQLSWSTGCTFTVPDYPMAPDHNYMDAFAMVETLYQEMIVKTDPDNIIFMGDSAGGGFALALAQKMKIGQVVKPGRVILISPWLDFTLTNPLIPPLERKSLLLELKSLLKVSRSYAGDTPGNHYQLSPINGPLDGLPEISLFTGTHDLLFPDCLKFKNLMLEQGLSLNYYEFPKMIHDWPLISFLPEAKAAVKIIETLISSTNQKKYL